MSHYTKIYKTSKRMRDSLDLDYCSSSFLYFGGVFNKTIISLAHVGYEMNIANSALRGLVGYLSSHFECALIE